MYTDKKRGTILFAHGSRDPLWCKPIEAVATRMRNMAPQVEVRCAYLELMMPDLPSSVSELATRGVNTITIVPMFLGVGRHAREDLPLLVAALKQDHPGIDFDLRPAIGEDPQMIELMAQMALT